MAGREEPKDGLRKIPEQRNKGKRVEARQEPVPRQMPLPTVEENGSSSDESYSSDEYTRNLKSNPNVRSWRHGIGKKTVRVPDDSRKAVPQAHHDTSDPEAGSPEKLLEQMATSRWRPVGATKATSVGSTLSHYREMGKHFTLGSVGDASRVAHVRDDSQERSEWLKSLNLK